MASSSGWPAGQQQQMHLPHQQHIAHSMVSEHYASMPPMSSPYPGQAQINTAGANAFLQQQHLQQQQQRAVGGPDIANSQASNNSNEGNSSSGGGSSEHRRKAVLPPAPSISSSVPVHSTQQYFSSQRMGPGQIMLEERAGGGQQGRNSFRVACNNYPVEEFFVDHL
uniref:Uncharacterized protein n=1 Tax=Ditylenchus dipsaci TaxID=166011 RepID=A0A915EK01_9BILA